nr:uncharacterized protein LOC113693231 [Coffea arabica]
MPKHSRCPFPASRSTSLAAPQSLHHLTSTIINSLHHINSNPPQHNFLISISCCNREKRKERNRKLQYFFFFSFFCSDRELRGKKGEQHCVSFNPCCNFNQLQPSPTTNTTSATTGNQDSSQPSSRVRAEREETLAFCREYKLRSEVLKLVLKRIPERTIKDFLVQLLLNRFWKLRVLKFTCIFLWM